MHNKVTLFTSRLQCIRSRLRLSLLSFVYDRSLHLRLRTSCDIPQWPSTVGSVNKDQIIS